MDWNLIVKYFISTSIVTAGLIYIAKLFFDNIAKTRVESYKMGLQKEVEEFKYNLNLETERFVSEINLKTIEHQVIYSKLYEERGQIIKNIYVKMVELEEALENLTNPIQGPDWTNSDLDKKANEEYNSLTKYLEINRLFFSETLCEEIRNILNESDKIISGMSMAKTKQKQNQRFKEHNLQLSPDELSAPEEKWMELGDKVQINITKARFDLAKEFRLLIGVN